MQPHPVGFRKQIAKALYLTEKTLSLQMNRELWGFKDLWVYVRLQGKFKVLSAKVNITKSC